MGRKEDWAFGLSETVFTLREIPHSQQWGLGVATLYVVDDCHQIFSIAGTEGPMGLRQEPDHWGREVLGQKAEK